jgi:Family of unknown function (DUF6353)
MIPAVVVKNAHLLKFFVQDNSTVILTGMGVSGTVATAVLTARASFKAADILAKEQEAADTELRITLEKDPDAPVIIPAGKLSKTEKVMKVWPLYIPPAITCTTTIAAIVVSHRISSKKIAALAIASGISERALQEYKDKLVERLGEKQARNVRDEIAQDRVTKDPVTGKEVILTGNGEVLCYDNYTGRYFMSTIEDIKRAENKINFEMVNFMSASLTQFYDEIGLPPTTLSDNVGWNINNRVEVEYSTTMSTDGRPCISIDFIRAPIFDYDRKAYD